MTAENMQFNKYLFHLLQFEGFQDWIRVLMSKFSENLLTNLAYTLGGIIVLITIYGLLARKK